MKTALLVIDIQTALIEAKPYAVDNCLSVWQKAIATCREKNIEVIYVRHNLSVWQKAIATCREKNIEVIYVRHNDDELLTGSHGWEIYEAIAPEVDEKIFDKHYNSAFKKTHLQTYLDSQSIDQLIIIGMATNYCIDTTVKVAFEFGYDLVVIKNGTTTFAEREITAEQLIQHYESTWNGRFAQVADLEEILKED